VELHVMRKNLPVVFGLVLFLLILLCSHALAGPFAPPAGQRGSTAIHMDDPSFVAWAVDYTAYERGRDLDVVFQTPEKALGKANGTSFDVVSLGEGGSITMLFDTPVQDGEGWDFAVFANPFNDHFLELAYVEVSTNGMDFVRFDNISLTPGPVSSFGAVEAGLIDGLAGKYRQGFGVPFNLSDLSQRPEVLDGLVDLQAIEYVRIVDIIGDGSCRDSEGNPIYDPYPTKGAAGFDLDAIGVSNGAPYPEGSIEEPGWPDPPDKEGEAGFNGHSGCFVQSIGS
jgi:hypothetical protein